MCGYGECEPRVDGEYSIQTLSRLRAAAAFEVEQGCLVGAPSVSCATYAGSTAVAPPPASPPASPPAET